MPIWVRVVGIVAAVPFLIVGVQLFLGQPLDALSRPLPSLPIRSWRQRCLAGRGRTIAPPSDQGMESDQPWRVADAQSDFIERILSAIVGFEVPISELKGKWKLSQNRSERDRLGVVAGLNGESDTSVTEMLRWTRSEDRDGA
jgi:Putative FMN-binding domain